MWIKKTQTELEKELHPNLLPRKKRLKNAFYDFLAFHFLFSFCPILNSKSRGGGSYLDVVRRKPYTWIEVYDKLHTYLFYILIISIILFFLAYLRGKPFVFLVFKNKPLYICEECHKITDEKSENCECGGNIIDSELMKWVED